MATTEETEKKWLTTREAGEMYDVTRETVVDWIHRGIYHRGVQVKLKGLRVGATHRIRPADLDAFLAALNGGVSPTATVLPHQTASHKRAKAELAKRLGRNRPNDHRTADEIAEEVPAQSASGDCC